MGRGSLIAVIAVLLLFSCEEGYMTDCRECDPEYPQQATLVIRYRTPDFIPENPRVTLFEGAIEDSIILSRFVIAEPYSQLTFDAILFKDYSATLEFIHEGQKYITTGAARPKVRYDETSCDEPCYYVYDNVIDLRLRYH
jgi:hypothetical protein